MLQAEQDIRNVATRNSRGSGASADLSAAGIATGPGADKPSDVVALVGYLGAAGSDGYRRLYRNQALELYIEIRGSDIVEHPSAAGDGGSTADQTVIWVRRDAVVVWRESMRASSFETRRFAGYKWPRP